MTDSISKVPASPKTPKDSVKAVVDKQGILLGAEVEINGVGMSLPAEQFTSMDSEMAHPKVIWKDGHSRREIFIDTAKKTSYVRSIQDNTPDSESKPAQVITIVATVVVHMETSAKAAAGIKTTAAEKPKKEAVSSPAETIVIGGLNVEKPEAEEAVEVTPQVDTAPVVSAPVTNTLFRSGILFLEPDDKTPSRYGRLSVIETNSSLNGMDHLTDFGVDASIGIPGNTLRHVTDSDSTPAHFSNPSLLLSGATYIWVDVQSNDGEDDRATPLNTNNSPAALNARIAEARDIKISNDTAGSEEKYYGPDNPPMNPFAATHDTAPQPSKPVELSDKAPAVLEEEFLNPIGAPVAPPPPATVAVFAALKPMAIKDSPLVERPSRSPGSDGEDGDGHHQHGQRDGHQNPQDEESPEQ